MEFRNGNRRDGRIILVRGSATSSKKEMPKRARCRSEIRGVLKWDQKPSDDVQEIRWTTDRSPREAETETGIAAQLCAHPKHRKSGAEKVCPPNLQEPGPTEIRQDNV
jgi:hypothetical protein